ncbi:MAG TPA: ribulose-phosphate 3-epimerase [Syntrophorhabdaceae bacterium]|nr:ribulose-phosphate 3-epimerase [Syntrophorhabdaceae bacterium]HQM81500.1 ribulose-phosphate 3-epimerase [Syntrophorhabdaceae bacterium]
MNRVFIAPSILSCNFLALEKEIRDVERAGADLIHIDVMDGHFVPNITIGPMIVEAVKRVATKPLDVHLMIENPARYAEDFIAAGADIVTVHVEADSHLYRTVDVIKSKGKRAGVSLNPSTPLSKLDHIINEVDMILIMSVNPGFGGQQYIAAMDDKIKKTRQLIQGSGRTIDLEVDGGIKTENAKRVADAGANILVLGTGIFHTKDYKKTIDEVRKRVG